MKFYGCIAVFALLFNLSTQIPQFQNCSSNFILQNQNECTNIICTEYANGISSFSAVGCATYLCQPDKYLGYEEQDNSKVYPDCCGGPICAD